MTLSVDVPDPMKKKLEEKKETEYYNSMSEVVREALREFIKKDEKKEMTPKDKAILEMIKQGKVENVKLENKVQEKIEESLKQVENNEHSKIE